MNTLKYQNMKLQTFTLFQFLFIILFFSFPKNSYSAIAYPDSIHYEVSEVYNWKSIDYDSKKQKKSKFFLKNLFKKKRFKSEKKDKIRDPKKLTKLTSATTGWAYGGVFIAFGLGMSQVIIPTLIVIVGSFVLGILGQVFGRRAIRIMGNNPEYEAERKKVKRALFWSTILIIFFTFQLILLGFAIALGD